MELERFGLIERKRNCGATVRQLTLEDVAQIYAVREILKRAAAAQIPLPMKKADLARIVGGVENPRDFGDTRKSGMAHA